MVELDSSLLEVESIFNMKNEYNRSGSRNEFMEEEIERLRKLLNYSKDYGLVQNKTVEYLNKQIQTQSFDEDILEICDSAEIEGADYEEVMQTVYNDRFGEGDSDDYDSENDSFASAAESVDLEVLSLKSP